MTLSDTLSASGIDNAERGLRIAGANASWNQRIAANPASAALTYRVRGVAEGAIGTTITAGKHSFFVDEPAALAGDDLAPSPVEYALAGLVSCQVVIYRLWAEALGIQVDDIAVDVEGDLDARGLFGTDDAVRPGFTAIRLEVAITGPETQERYEELRETVDAHCPVIDLFANATPVTVTVTKA